MVFCDALLFVWDFAQASLGGFGVFGSKCSRLMGPASSSDMVVDLMLCSRRCLSVSVCAFAATGDDLLELMALFAQGALWVELFDPKLCGISFGGALLL